MSPEIYYRIVLLVLARDSVAMGFSLADFFANGGKQILLNNAAQYGGYIAATAVGNTVTLIPCRCRSFRRSFSKVAMAAKLVEIN